MTMTIVDIISMSRASAAGFWDDLVNVGMVADLFEDIGYPDVANALRLCDHAQAFVYVDPWTLTDGGFRMNGDNVEFGWAEHDWKLIMWARARE